MKKDHLNRRDFISSAGLGIAAGLSITHAAAAADAPQIYRRDSRGRSIPAPQRDLTNSPNILWIYVEDICPLLSCYGHDINPTPNLDKLADDGIRFDKAFTPTPVCSPARSAIITGMMSTTIGTHNHHSSRTVESGIFLDIQTLPQMLRQAGYYTFNRGKDDYNFIYNRKDLYTGDVLTHFWYTFESKQGSWRDPERKPDQPFFGQIQLEGGKLVFDQVKFEAFKNRIDRSKVKLPPYYPDHPVLLEDWAQHYDSIRMTDIEVGEIIADLKDAGELENTIIFFFSDHGYKGSRHKQFCYDSGIQVPLILAGYGRQDTIKPGTVRKDLVSLIDVSATTLALAGLSVPSYMEGRDLLAEDYTPREFIIATRDRCDFTIDRIRAVRTDRYKYIKNFMTDRPLMQPNYRQNRPEYQVQKKLYEEGKMARAQAQFWSETRMPEELYDLEKDPHEINNLADSPEHLPILMKMRGILENWIEQTDDKGQYPEGEEALRFMFERWGTDCVNPEYDYVKTHPRNGTPPHLQKI